MLRIIIHSCKSRLVFTAALLLISCGLFAETPSVELRGTPGLQGRIEVPSTRQLQHLVEVVGFADSGPPIRLSVVSRASAEARRAPSWAAGYAFPEAGEVFVIADRIPTYPHSRIQQVVIHEIAHVLIARAANRQPIPRWFSEGLAVVASREWQLMDRARTLFASSNRDLADLDRRFLGGSHAAADAYAVSAAFVRFLLETHGRELPGRIFAKMRRGMSFDAAFRQAAGDSLGHHFEQFDSSFDGWSRWLPLVSSSTTLWAGISLLALVAFVRRHQRDQAIRQSWIEEELDSTIN